MGMEGIPDKKASEDLERPMLPELPQTPESNLPIPEIIRGPLDRLRKEHVEDRERAQRIDEIRRPRYIQ